MATWPSTLPQRATRDGFQESADGVVLRSTVDVGPAKLRPRYTAEVKVFACALVLDSTQVATLETFYETTTVFGTGPFDWVHPRTEAAASLRFRNRPTYSALGAGRFRASFALELLP